MANKSNRLTYTIEINEKGKVKIDGLTKSFIEADNALNKLTADFKKQQAAMANMTTKGLNPMIDKTGLAGATLVELGRTISDLPYGIRGIANNLSQLSTLFITLVTTTGGFREGIASLLKTFRGPLGFIVLFQAAVAALDYFAGSSKKVTDKLAELRKETEQTKQSLSAYVTVLEEYNLSQSRRSNLEQQLIDKLPDIEKLNTNSKEGIDRLRESIALYVRQQEIRAEIDLLVEENAEGFIEDRKRRAILERLMSEGVRDDQAKQIEIIKENTNILERLAIESMGADGRGLIARLIQGDRYETTDLIKGFQQFVEEEGGPVAEARKRIADLTAELVGYSKSSGGARASLRTFKQQFLDFDKDIEKLRQESLDQFVRDQETRIAKESTDLMMMFRIRTDDFKERQKQRLEEFKESKATLNEKKKAEQEYNESIQLAERELAEVLIEIERRAESKRVEFRLKRTQQVLETLRKIQQAEANFADARLKIPALFTENAIKERTKQLEFEIELQRNIVKVHKEGTEERADAEVKLAELQKRLIDENVSYQRQRFNQINEIYSQGAATIGFISEAIKNKEIRDAGESAEAIEAAQKKAWQIEKMLKISQVIMRTYEAGWLAYGSQLQIGDPTSPLRAKIAQVLTIASGVAQVAAIASTKFDSKSISGAGGGGRGAGPQVEAPDFNVVGASPESQLAQSVSAQQEKPLRAFVVHQDIKNANELDRKITEPTKL